MLDEIFVVGRRPSRDIWRVEKVVGCVRSPETRHTFVY